MAIGSNVDKGKGRAIDTSASTGVSSSATASAVTASSTTRAAPAANRNKTPVRHGRGPLIRDSDDDAAIDDALDRDDVDDPATRLLDPQRDDEAAIGGTYDDRTRASMRRRPDAAAITAKRRKDTASIAGNHAGSGRHQSDPRRRASEIVCYLLGIITFALLLAFAVVHLWIGHLVSEQAQHGDLQLMAQRGLVINGPSAVRVAEAETGTDSAFVLELDMLMGVDVRKALEWEEKERARWYRRLEARIAAWATHRIDTVTIDLGRVALREPYKIERTHDTAPLVVIEKVSPLIIPLSYPRGPVGVDLPSFNSVRLRLPVSLPEPKELLRVGRKVWEERKYDLELDVHDIVVTLGGASSSDVFGRIVRRIKGVSVSRVARQFIGKVPDLPGASDPASLVELLSYDIFEKRPAHSNATVIGLAAQALLTNPISDATKSGQVPAFEWGVPFRIPVGVYLPDPPSTMPPRFSVSDKAMRDDGILLAKVVAMPFHFDAGQERTKMSVDGHLVRAGDLTKHRSDDDQALSAALSRFLARYLDGKKNQVLVRYDASTPLDDAIRAGAKDQDNAPYPPRAVADLLKDVTVPLTFPGSENKMQLFKNLKIEDMKIKLSGMVQPLGHALSLWEGGDDDEPEGDLLCSGRVVGEIDLPPQFKKLEMSLDVKGIWPDVYVYDGDLPPAARLLRRDQITFVADADADAIASDVDKELGTVAPSYPPVPTPATAFARLHPASLITATTTHRPANRTHNATTIISATFVDAPLFLLPGRGDVFRRFVSKILFGGPGAKAKAGVRGVSAAQVGLGGWGAIGVEGLPVEGEFWVGSGSGGAQEKESNDVQA